MVGPVLFALGFDVTITYILGALGLRKLESISDHLFGCSVDFVGQLSISYTVCTKFQNPSFIAYLLTAPSIQVRVRGFNDSFWQGLRRAVLLYGFMQCFGHTFYYT